MASGEGAQLQDRFGKDLSRAATDVVPKFRGSGSKCQRRLLQIPDEFVILDRQSSQGGRQPQAQFVQQAARQ